MANDNIDRGGDGSPRIGWMVGFVAVFFAVYAITVIAAGSPEYLIPAVILAIIVTGYAVFHRWLTGKQLARHGGDAQAAMADGDDPWPASPNIIDSSRPVGDTPEAHDEISPRDIPKGAPGRHAAEELAARNGTTGGHAEGAEGGEPMEGDDRTEERAGGRQASADR